jgi:cytochrome c oxidase subunit 3
MTHAHAHQFASIGQQRSALRVGMWTFLVTEIMFFGGLFLTYSVYRWSYPLAFAEGSRHLIETCGAINTGLLLISSFTVALSVRFAQTDQRRWLVVCLLLTIALGTAFLGVKAYEYWHEWHDGLVPGPYFHLAEQHDPRVDPQHVELFMSVYFATTGLHSLHMIIGLGIFSVLLLLALRRQISAEHYMPVEISGLYWHFVDIVWVFLFPLLYLVR